MRGMTVESSVSDNAGSTVMAPATVVVMLIKAGTVPCEAGIGCNVFLVCSVVCDRVLPEAAKLGPSADRLFVVLGYRTKDSMGAPQPFPDFVVPHLEGALADVASDEMKNKGIK